MVKALILDFDGVICQTETFKLDQMKCFIENLGIYVSKKELYQLAGGRILENKSILDRILGGQKRYWTEREKILSFRPECVPIASLKTDRIVETLQAVKDRKIRLAVASNSTKERLYRVLSECELLQYFDYIVPAFELKTRKPDPYVYLYTMKRMGVSPKNCVIVEDSASGIQAGKAAGVKVIALKDRDSAIDQRMADIIITHIDEILNFL